MSSLPNRDGGAHHERFDDVRPVMAKAVTKRDLAEARALVGWVICRTFDLAGLSQKEVAGLLERDHAQIARWMNGDERPQTDLILACPALRWSYAVAIAEAAGLDVATLITVPHQRRQA